MTDDITLRYFEKSRSILRSEHDSMLKKIKHEIDRMRSTALSKVSSSGTT
jgi:hypothetical protein